MVEDLAEHFHVLRYNSRGQGEAPLGPGLLDLETQVQDLLFLLQEYGIQKAHLLGLSHGARIGLAVAQKAPDKVERMALACCFANPDALISCKLNSWKQASKIGGAGHRFETALPWIWSQELLEKNGDLIQTYKRKASNISQEVVDNLIHAALSSTIKTSSIKAPTLLLAAREDLLTPAWKVQELSKELPFCEYLECSGAHSFLLEKPHLVKDSLIPFLKGKEGNSYELG